MWTGAGGGVDGGVGGGVGGGDGGGVLSSESLLEVKAENELLVGEVWSGVTGVMRRVRCCLRWIARS